jgi:phenylpyruvate tautomerase PptA (4-oxalocrotonate tautomerase family)
MPVLEISALPQREGIDVRAAVAAVCTEVAAVLGEDASDTWAAWRTVDCYVEGATAADVQPERTHPPLVRVTAFEGRPAEQIETVIRCVSEALARELRLEAGNVFVLYEEGRSGRLSSGGELMRR